MGWKVECVFGSKKKQNEFVYVAEDISIAIKAQIFLYSKEIARTIRRRHEQHRNDGNKSLCDLSDRNLQITKFKSQRNLCLGLLEQQYEDKENIKWYFE